MESAKKPRMRMSLGCESCCEEELSYSEQILSSKEFFFQTRQDKMDLLVAGIDQIDVDSIIRNTKVEKLQDILEVITFNSLTLEDMSMHEPQTIHRLIIVMQLTIEYLLNVQDVLAQELDQREKLRCDKKILLEKNLNASTKEDFATCESTQKTDLGVSENTKQHTGLNMVDVLLSSYQEFLCLSRILREEMARGRSREDELKSDLNVLRSNVQDQMKGERVKENEFSQQCGKNSLHGQTLNATNPSDQTNTEISSEDKKAARALLSIRHSSDTFPSNKENVSNCIKTCKQTPVTKIVSNFESLCGHVDQGIKSHLSNRDVEGSKQKSVKDFELIHNDKDKLKSLRREVQLTKGERDASNFVDIREVQANYSPGKCIIQNQRDQGNQSICSFATSSRQESFCLSTSHLLEDEIDGYGVDEDGRMCSFRSNVSVNSFEALWDGTCKGNINKLNGSDDVEGKNDGKSLNKEINVCTKVVNHEVKEPLLASRLRDSNKHKSRKEGAINKKRTRFFKRFRNSFGGWHLFRSDERIVSS